MRIRTFCLALMVAVVASFSFAEEHIPVVACEEKPITKRTAEVTSNNGARAFLQVIVRVVATGNYEGDLSVATHKCAARWTLYVAAPNQKKFTAVPFHVYTERQFETTFGGDSATYYGGSVLGWSPDGTRLLASAQIGGYEDWYLPTPIVYSMTDQKWWKADLKAAFALQQNPRSKPSDSGQCELAFVLHGFAPDNRVVIEASPFEWVEPPNCFQPGHWLLDYRSGELERASSGMKGELESER